MNIINGLFTEQAIIICYCLLHTQVLLVVVATLPRTGVVMTETEFRFKCSQLMEYYQYVEWGRRAKDKYVKPVHCIRLEKDLSEAIEWDEKLTQIACSLK